MILPQKKRPTQRTGYVCYALETDTHYGIYDIRLSVSRNTDMNTAGNPDSEIKQPKTLPLVYFIVPSRDKYKLFSVSREGVDRMSETIRAVRKSEILPSQEA